MEVSQALGDKGAPLPVPLSDGRTYYLSRFSKRRQSAIEMWLIEVAKADAAKDRTRLNLSDDVYAKYLASINLQVTSGVYKIGGPAYAVAIQTFDGLCRLAKLLLQPKHPDITDEEVEELLEDHMPEFRSGLDLTLAAFREVNGLDASGNPLKPAPKETEPA